MKQSTVDVGNASCKTLYSVGSHYVSKGRYLSVMIKS